MKKNIKLTESQFNKFIVETCKKVLNEDMAYMSDEDIANQYSDMKITYFEINPLRNSEGWEGTFELEFPNADDIDYDSTMVNDFFVYDSEGNRIAWDYWMPDEQTRYLNDIIRKEIAKRSVKESITKSDLHNLINESVNKVLTELDWRTYASAAKKRDAQWNQSKEGLNARDKGGHRLSRLAAKLDDAASDALTAKYKKKKNNWGTDNKAKVHTNGYQRYTTYNSDGKDWWHSRGDFNYGNKGYVDKYGNQTYTPMDNEVLNFMKGKSKYVKGQGWQ